MASKIIFTLSSLIVLVLIVVGITTSIMSDVPDSITTSIEFYNQCERFGGDDPVKWADSFGKCSELGEVAKNGGEIIIE